MRTEDVRIQQSDAGGSIERGQASRLAAWPSLAALIILAVGFRLPLLFVLRYGNSVPDFSDFRYFYDVASLSAQGYFPDIHFWVEYPPLFPWLAVGAYQLSLLIPMWLHPYFWFYLILTAVMAAADAGTIVLIDRLGDALWGKPLGRRSATLYAAMFLPAFALTGWFDTLPTFFLLLGLYAVIVGAGRGPRPGAAWSTLAGIGIGIGTMLKLFPILALPAATVVRWNRAASGIRPHPNPLPEGEGTEVPQRRIDGLLSSQAKGTQSVTPRQHDHPLPEGDRSNAELPLPLGEGGGEGVPRSRPAFGREALLQTAIVGICATATIVAISVPFLLRSRDTFLATFRNVLARGSWMSLWAILDGYYGTGTVASLQDRLFYNASAGWGQPSHDQALWWATVVVVLGLYLWRWWVAYQAGTPRAAIALTGFAVCVLELLSRGFSQQFTVWILPFVALLLPGVDGAVLAVLLTLNNVAIEGYVYVTLFSNLHQLLWITATVRTVLILWLAVECAIAIDARTPLRFATVRRLAVTSVLALVLVGGIAALVSIAPRVEAAMLARTGDASAVAAIERMDPATALVFTQPEVFDRLAADVRPRATLLVAEPKLLTWTGDRSLYHRLDTGLTGRANVVLVTDTKQPTSPLLPAVRGWLGARYGALSPIDAGSVVLEEYARDHLPTERSVNAQFGDSITLVGYRPATLGGKPGAPLAVALEWQATKPLDRDYTVSSQLLDSQGKLVAQHDGMPANNALPTSTWRPGETITDAIDLPLPATLAPGGYQLIVVVYDHQTLQRLPVHGPGQSGDQATLGKVEIN